MNEPHVDPYLAVKVVARLLKEQDEANPDVGMGYSNAYFVRVALETLEILVYDFGEEAGIKIEGEI